ADARACGPHEERQASARRAPPPRANARRDAATRRGPGGRDERADGGRRRGAAGGDRGADPGDGVMTSNAVRRLGGQAVRATLALVSLTAYPPNRLSAQDSLPIGFGTLKRDDIIVRFDTPALEIQLLPLEEIVTRLLARDTYRSLQGLVRSRRSVVDDLSPRAGVLRPERARRPPARHQHRRGERVGGHRVPRHHGGLPQGAARPSGRRIHHVATDERAVAHDGYAVGGRGERRVA